LDREEEISSAKLESIRDQLLALMLELRMGNNDLDDEERDEEVTWAALSALTSVLIHHNKLSAADTKAVITRVLDDILGEGTEETWEWICNYAAEKAGLPIEAAKAILDEAGLHAYRHYGIVDAIETVTGRAHE
jgi:hypothetical protein